MLFCCVPLLNAVSDPFICSQSVPVLVVEHRDMHVHIVINAHIGFPLIRPIQSTDILAQSPSNLTGEASINVSSLGQSKPSPIFCPVATTINIKLKEGNYVWNENYVTPENTTIYMVGTNIKMEEEIMLYLLSLIKKILKCMKEKTMQLIADFKFYLWY